MIVHDVAQRSDAWYALRAGKPTASEFSKIVTSAGEPSKQAGGYALTLAVELYAGKPVDVWEGNAWTERGREMEQEALRLYSFTHDVEIETCGFVTDDADTMGCSPDGLLAGDGMVEVKCLRAANHAKTIVYHQKHGRCPTDYMQQTQGQLLVCGRRWCDLVFYHPDLPMLTIRQEVNEKLQAALLAGIPTLCRERDNVLAALRRAESPGEAAA